MDPTFTNPIAGIALGDPFVLRHRGRFYLYGTNDGPPLPGGRQIPGYRSDDLIAWEPLGGVLEPVEPGADHWAPEVLAWNGRFYMVVSFGDVDRAGHALWVATSDRPEGPFRPERRLSDPAEAFSIDGSWLLDDVGRLYLFRCLDFVAEGEPPHGTGIVVQPMTDPFTPAGPPATVLRAHSAWHRFESDRTMPLYGGRTFPEWTTIEGPAPVKRAGRYFCGYSGGHYAGAYGTGEASAEAPLGPYVDLRGRDGPIFGTTPGLVEGPGHFSVVTPDLVRDWIVLHGRLPGEGVRRVWLCPAAWGEAGVEIGPLTDRPQDRPALPSLRAPLAEFGLSGWAVEAGRWSHVPGDGVAATGVGEAILWLDGPIPGGSFLAEVFVRFPGPGPAAAGLILGGGAGRSGILIDPARSRLLIRSTADPRAGKAGPLPELGAIRFDPTSYHALSLRLSSGSMEIRVDGVVAASVPAAPGSDLGGATRLGLTATGEATFDALAVSEITAGRA